MKTFVAFLGIVAFAALVIDSCAALDIPGADMAGKMAETAADMAGKAVDVGASAVEAGVEVGKTAAEAGIDVAKTGAKAGIDAAGGMASMAGGSRK